MTDDYLLEEFHEAGIWLPEELEAIRAQQENQRNWLKQEAMMQAMQQPFGPQSLQYQQALQQLNLPPGTMIPVDSKGRLLPSGIFGGLFGGLR